MGAGHTPPKVKEWPPKGVWYVVEKERISIIVAKLQR
jgi:hypothetical protein